MGVRAAHINLRNPEIRIICPYTNPLSRLPRRPRVPGKHGCPGACVAPMGAGGNGDVLFLALLGCGACGAAALGGGSVRGLRDGPG